MHSLFGIQVVSHPLAERTIKKACIKRTAIKKRRRGWVLTFEKKSEPSAYQIGNTIYMHPELYAKLKGRTP